VNLAGKGTSRKNELPGYSAQHIGVQTWVWLNRKGPTRVSAQKKDCRKWVPKSKKKWGTPTRKNLTTDGGIKKMRILKRPCWPNETVKKAIVNGFPIKSRKESGKKNLGRSAAPKNGEKVKNPCKQKSRSNKNKNT